VCSPANEAARSVEPCIKATYRLWRWEQWHRKPRLHGKYYTDSGWPTEDTVPVAGNCVPRSHTEWTEGTPDMHERVSHRIRGLSTNGPKSGKRKFSYFPIQPTDTRRVGLKALSHGSLHSLFAWLQTNSCGFEVSIYHSPWDSRCLLQTNPCGFEGRHSARKTDSVSITDGYVWDRRQRCRWLLLAVVRVVPWVDCGACRVTTMGRETLSCHPCPVKVKLLDVHFYW